MKVTIIPSDRAVYVDGSAVTGLSIAAPEGVRALQWKDARGWIERDDGSENEPIFSLPKWAIDAIAARAQKIADDLAAANAPPTPEQLAQQALREKYAAESAEAKTDAKLSALARMSPSEVRAHVAANISNLADAKDVLATLAVAVSVLTRRI